KGKVVSIKCASCTCKIGRHESLMRLTPKSFAARLGSIRVYESPVASHTTQEECPRLPALPQAIRQDFHPFPNPLSLLFLLTFAVNLALPTSLHCVRVVSLCLPA